MRWFAFLPLAFMIGCRLLTGGVTGSWASNSGLRLDMGADRSWSGTYRTSYGTVELSGQWTLNDETVKLIPIHWENQVAYPDLNSSSGLKSGLEQETKLIVALLQAKTFRLVEKGDKRVLRDNSPVNNQTLHPVD